MIKAIIIDDLPQSIELLKRMLKEYCPKVEVIGTAVSVVTGAKLLRELKPDVLFLDIQMPDGTGFDLLEILPEIPFAIIFTTASDAFAIKAFRFSAVDYLLKPIDPEELLASVRKIDRQALPQRERYELLLDTMKGSSTPKRLALHTQEKIHIIIVADIIRCEASGNYTTFYIKDHKKLLVTKTLKEFDKMLHDQHFLRVHQSHLINTLHLKEFVKVDGGYLVMQNGTQVPVSVRRRAEVVRMLEEL